MIDAVARALFTQKASIEPQKAVTGPGAAIMSWGIPVSQAAQDTHRMMREAQAVYARGNRWVRRAEMTISNRVGSVPWHLETDDGETITDESPEELRRIRDLFEKPLGDEQFARQYPSQPSTRRNHWGITSRHAGLCNVAFWHLDEIDRAAQFPQRIYTIRPDRMTPEESNGVLTGWTLDKDNGGGISLSLEEVLPFYLDQPDRGYFGHGLVESVYGTLHLPDAIDLHARDTLGSGGRLPGIYAPNAAAGALGDDVYERLVGDLRTIKDMPDSSKRDIVARAPIEFTPTAADMSSLVVTALSQMSRDDTLTHWGVPLSTIGGTTAAGLNSGESRKYDEAALWQNAVQFRVDMLWETIQYRLLDRLQRVGISLRLVIETPEFDDNAPKYEIAAKSISLPLRNVERRALLGLDPFGDPALDNAIVLPVNMVNYADGSDDAEETPPEEGMKASLDDERERVRDASVKRLQADVAKVLNAMGKEIAGRVRRNAEAIARKPGDTDVWMPKSKRNEWEQALAKALNPHLTLAAETMGAKVRTQLGKTGKADEVLGSSVLARLMKSVGKRISGIMDTTREDVQRVITQGLEQGLGAAALGDAIEAATTFNEYRAELIARTETAQVLNEAALASYSEYGVTRVQAIDGDDDPECAERNGREFEIEEAYAISDHPNGTLDWVPVLAPAKAADVIPFPEVPVKQPQFTIPQISLTIEQDTSQLADAMRERDAEQLAAMKALSEVRPVVNVAPAAVVVDVPAQAAPVVNVEQVVIPAPVVNVEQPSEKAALPQEIRIVSMPDRTSSTRKTVKRGPNGLVTEVTEVTVDEDG